MAKRVELEAGRISRDGHGRTLQEFRGSLPSGRTGKVPAGFDPWTFDLDAWKADAARAPFDGVGEAWLSQAIAADQLKRDRDRIEANGYQLLNAISFIAEHGLVMPDWLAQAYLRRFRRVVNLEVATLDAAFGPLPRKGEKVIRNLKRRRELLPLLNEKLCTVIQEDPSRPVDKALFEEVSKFFGIGATLAEELYREGVKEHRLQDLTQLKAALSSRSPKSRE